MVKQKTSRRRAADGTPRKRVGKWAEGLQLKALVELSCDPANAKTHDEHNIDAIARSLQQFGQLKPVVLDADGTVIAGNGTFLAAKQLGWTHLAVTQTDLTGARARAYALADNKTAELSGWDNGQLAAAFELLRECDAELTAATAFSEQEVEQIVRQALRDQRPDAQLVPDDDEDEADPDDEEDADEDTAAAVLSRLDESDKPNQPARKPEPKFPLSIVLTAGEYHKWKAFADGRPDGAAFRELLDRINA